MVNAWIYIVVQNSLFEILVTVFKIVIIIIITFIMYKEIGFSKSCFSKTIYTIKITDATIHWNFEATIIHGVLLNVHYFRLSVFGASHCYNLIRTNAVFCPDWKAVFKLNLKKIISAALLQKRLRWPYGKILGHVAISLPRVLDIVPH